MDKKFWERLKLFASVVEEANDKIKEDKEIILAVCEEQLNKTPKCLTCGQELDKHILAGYCSSECAFKY